MRSTRVLPSIVAVLGAVLVTAVLPVYPARGADTFTALAIDSQTPTTRYAGTSERGVLKSVDGGTTWRPTGLTNIRVTSLAIDPETPSVVYAGTAGGGVFKSVDGGATWRASNVGLTKLNVADLVIAPQSPMTLYAVIPDAGVFKSTDGAATWSLAENCVPEDCANGIDDDCDGAVDAEDPDCLGCEVQECMSAECPAGHVCGFDGCCIPHCFDGAWNGDEGDTDCGGACDAKCQNGQRCTINFDCQSGFCDGNSCAPVIAAALSSLSVNPTSVPGGNPSSGTATLSAPAPAGGAVVALSISDPSVATVPAGVTVAAGTTSATFTVSTTSVTASTTVTISGTYSGVTKSASLTVTAAATLSSLSLNPTSVPAGAASTGTVTLSTPAPAEGATIAVSSSDATVATVPLSVTVAPDAVTASFTVSTSHRCMTAAATISGTYGGVTRSSVLTVSPPTMDTVAIQRAEYFRNRQLLRVWATSSDSTATLQVFVMSSGQLIGTLNNNGGGNYSGQFNLQPDPQSITVRSSSCGAATSQVTSK